MRMRFKKINERYSVTRNVGQKGGFRFTYAFIDGWYVTVNRCENFYYKNFKCLGTDA
jgi:hypothetical protein